MQKIKAVIVDDESKARVLLSKLLEAHCPEVEVVAEADDLPNGVKAIRKQKADLVFLDVDMPGHSGLELLDFFDEQEVDFGIIFTTAYNQYAIKAFKLSAIDYLLKPIEPEELEAAVKRFKNDWQKRKLSGDIEKSGRIAVPVGQSIRFIDAENITVLRAENSYTEIIMNDQTKLLVSRTLKNFEEALTDNPTFFRCHKSYIINKNYLKDYVKSDGGYLVLKNGAEIPIAGDKVGEFLEEWKIVKRQ